MNGPVAGNRTAPGRVTDKAGRVYPHGTTTCLLITPSS